MENQDPFAEDKDTDASTPDPAAAADPFGDAPSGDAEFDEYEIPPTPIGVLPGVIESAKYLTTERSGTTKKSLVLEIQCSEPQFASAGTVSVWIEVPRFLRRAAAFASILGLPVQQSGNRIALPKPEKFVNKPGKFVYSTYTDKQGVEQPTIAWGCPKPGKSEQWDAWLAEAGLTDEQVAEIKKSPGVLPLSFGS